MPWQENKPSGMFKKILIPKPELILEQSKIQSSLVEVKDLWEKKQINDAWATLSICFTYLRYRYSLLNKKNIPFINQDDSIPFLEKEQLYGIPQNIRFTFVEWLKGNWDMRLVSYIPSSYEMALAQSRGFRFISIDWDCAFTGNLIFNTRDALEFILHDIAHGYTFFHSSYNRQEQIDFFQKLTNNYTVFEQLCKEDPIYNEKFDYCLSDMNSHPFHLTSYLKAITIEYYLRKRQVVELSKEDKEEIENLFLFLKQAEVAKPIFQ